VSVDLSSCVSRAHSTPAVQQDHPRRVEVVKLADKGRQSKHHDKDEETLDPLEAQLLRRKEKKLRKRELKQQQQQLQQQQQQQQQQQHGSSSKKHRHSTDSRYDTELQTAVTTPKGESKSARSWRKKAGKATAAAEPQFTPHRLNKHSGSGKKKLKGDTRAPPTEGRADGGGQQYHGGKFSSHKRQRNDW
jgi:hypothetical protein